MTHFANADELEHPRLAVRRAGAALPRRRRRACEGERSLSNSGGVLHQAVLQAELHNDWVRPGIMLYGGTPGRRAQRARLRPAPDDDAELAKSSRSRTCRPATRSATAAASRPTGAMHGRRGRLRLCRRLSAPRAARHPDDRRRRAHHAGRARVDGHDDGRPDADRATRASAARSRSGATACRSTRWRAPPARSAMN